VLELVLAREQYGRHGYYLLVLVSAEWAVTGHTRQAGR
jgi:hypothetical protein